MRVLPFFAALVTAGVASAHPMGNLSVNHYARLEPNARGLDVTYVLDLGEIPAFELTQSWGVDRDASQDVLLAKASGQVPQWISHLSFTENGKALQPKIEDTQLSVRAGAGNLQVFRITTKLHIPATGGRLEYEDHNYPARSGWREIVIHPGDRAAVARASTSDLDLSQALTVYPLDPANGPPRQTRAWFEWKPFSGPATSIPKPVIVATAQPAPLFTATPSAPNAPAPTTRKRTDSIAKLLRMDSLSAPLLATLIGLAFWFGALHALEPGHGKTMVAAYLVGARGTPKHAALLGGIVTFTHTISVFVIGLVTMFLSRYIMPDRISKVLGIVSGLSIIWIGGLLLLRRWRSLNPKHHHHAHDHPHPHSHDHHHSHDHDHAHSHDHHHSDDHAHSHDHHHVHTHDGHAHSHIPEGDISIRSLIALGASGGLVPCPSALILLLSAISLGKFGLGLVLLVAFSLGLAIVLTATGMLVLYAKNLLPETKRNDNAFFRYMPVISAAAILLIGVLMTGVSLGLVPASRFIG